MPTFQGTRFESEARDLLAFLEDHRVNKVAELDRLLDLLDGSRARLRSILSRSGTERRQSAMRKSGHRFFARIALKSIRIDHVYEFGLTQSKLIVIYVG